MLVIPTRSAVMASAKQDGHWLTQELDQLRRLLSPPLDALIRLPADDGVFSQDVDSVHFVARAVKDLVIRM